MVLFWSILVAQVLFRSRWEVQVQVLFWFRWEVQAQALFWFYFGGTCAGSILIRNSIYSACQVLLFLHRHRPLATGWLKCTDVLPSHSVRWFCVREFPRNIRLKKYWGKKLWNKAGQTPKKIQKSTHMSVIYSRVSRYRIDMCQIQHMEWWNNCLFSPVLFFPITHERSECQQLKS